MSPASKISTDELTVWSRFVYELCGVSLDNSKGYLFETRLNDLMAETGSASFSELYHKVKSDYSKKLSLKIVDAMTTNETSFFRDISTFELLKHKLLPDIIDRYTRAGIKPVPIRILSAACSTGQEIYSIAMTIKELLPSLNGYDIRLVGTDISDRVVAAASHAYYSQLEVNRGLSPQQVSRHFIKEDGRWKVKDELRAMVSFRKMNLLSPLSFPFSFDLVFCRNVAIYFTEQDKIKLFNNLARVMSNEGRLVIGSTETIGGFCPLFKSHRYLRSVFYQKG